MTRPVIEREGHRAFAATVLAVLAFALFPFPGRWKLLQQIVPVLLVVGFYRLNNYGLRRAALAPPPEGWKRCAALAMVLAVPLYFLEGLVFGRIAGLFFAGGKDLSLFEGLRGDLGALFIYLTFMWILAAFGEEFFWRGFLLRETGERSGRWAAALVASSVLFGLAHAYQGGYGVVEKTLGAMELGALYLWRGRSSIWFVVFFHGVQNTISFVALYLGVYEELNFLAP